METDAKSWAGRDRKLIIGLPIAALLVAAVVIVFIPGLVAPWSRLNNEEQELDLYSGRARFTSHFLYCQVRQEVRETPLSEALSRGGRPDSGEKWVLVNIFQPGGRHSPYFVYHGAFASANGLATLWTFYKFDPRAQEKSARQLLRAMREGAGRHYFQLLHDALGAGSVEGRTITANKIPDDLVDRALAKRAEEMRQQ